MMSFLIITLAAIIGLFVGSWVGTLAFRVADRLPAHGKSACRMCQEPVAAADLIPLLSYVRLRGRCRQCSSVIEWQFPVIELSVGIVFAALVARLYFQTDVWFDLPSEMQAALLVRDLVAAVFLILIFAYDVRQFVVPDRVSLPAIAMIGGMNILLGVPTLEWVLGGVVCAAVFALQYIVTRGMSVGAGDIRAGFLVGVILGFAGGLMAIVGAYILAAIVALPLLLTRRISVYDNVPFAAFLAASAIVFMCAGPSAQMLYLSFFG